MKNVAVGVWTDREFLWLKDPLDQPDRFTNQLPNVVLKEGDDPVDELVDQVNATSLKFVVAAEIGQIEEAELGFNMWGWLIQVEPTESEEFTLDEVRYLKVPIGDVMRGDVVVPEPFYEMLQLVAKRIEEGPSVA